MNCLDSAAVSLVSATSGQTGNATSHVIETAQSPKYWAVALLVFPVLTVFGNVLVCLSIYTEKGLHTVTNYFIFSLAVADVMVAILVMPLAVYVEVNNSIWSLGDTLCDTWVAFDVMCCTSSILNLTAISLDRFIAVTRPIQYAKHKNSRRVRLTLALTWIVSIAVSLPVAVGMNYTDRRAQTPWLCTFYNADFLIYSSMASFYIPCVLMLLLYWRIFRAIRMRADRKSAAQRTPELTTNPPSPNSASPSPLPVPVARFFRAELGADQQVRTSLCGDGCPGGDALVPVVTRVTPRRLAVHVPRVAGAQGLTIYRTLRLGSDVERPGQGFSTSSEDLADVASSEDGATRVGQGRLQVPGSDGQLQDEHRMSVDVARQRTRMRRAPLFGLAPKPFRKPERLSTKREKKATKTLAIVLGVFLFCWVPFFTINIVHAVCIRYDLFSSSPVCNIDPLAFSFFVWLGYINSFLNPVIYTIFNAEFRKAFKKLLTEPCRRR